MSERSISSIKASCESVFREIQPDTRVVIEHVVRPRYRLTVTLTARGDQTHLA